MIRFWISGTSAGPISTPRSPRATMTASVSRRIESSASTASAFSIFAITWACEPVPAIDRDWLVALADPHLRPLKIGDDRDRPFDFLRDLAHDLHQLRVVLVRPVREVEARGIHPGARQLEDGLARRRSGTERRDDLRPARELGGHMTQTSSRGRRQT